MKNEAIGIDLGCTNIKGLLLDESGVVRHELRSETREHDASHWKNEVRRMIQSLKEKSAGNVQSVGLCAPGLADAENTCIACMPGRLPGLEHFNWSAFTGEQVHVLNDAHAALTAEAGFGAARGFRHAVMFTLGSGVGGGILVDGKLYQGLGQMAGHLGHMTVDADDSALDVTNMPGSIEHAIGNITIAHRSHGKFTTTFELIEAYRRGETFATWLWLSSVRKLAITVASAINVISPEVVVIGGGIAQAGEILMKPLTEFLSYYEWKPGGKQTPLVAAQFSDMAGAMGAAAFALSKNNTQR